MFLGFESQQVADMTRRIRLGQEPGFPAWTPEDYQDRQGRAKAHAKIYRVHQDYVDRVDSLVYLSEPLPYTGGEDSQEPQSGEVEWGDDVTLGGT